MRTIAIVGSGPSGFYCVEALGPLLSDGRLSRIDMFERNVAPYGLARHGVAPDHPEMRAVEGKFAEWTRAFGGQGFRWFGGSPVSDLSVLRQRYDAVILAHGADQEKRLNVAGEAGNGGVVPAGRFVSWYNALMPADASASSDSYYFDPGSVLTAGDSAAVIGLGNVALDVARILLKDADELRGTDMPESCLRALRASTVRHVHIVGRRGPVHSAFTAKELREAMKLPGVRVVVHAADVASVEDEPASKALLASSRKHARIFELFRSAAASSSSSPAADKSLTFHFYRSPVEVLGGVEALRLRKNRVVDGDRLVETDDTELLPCSLVVPAIGYTPSLFAELPFDRAGNRVANSAGRVHGVDGVYVVGWLKRGPQGVIPDNRWDAQETVASLLADVEQLPRARLAMDDAELDAHFAQRIDFAQWSVVERVERERGAALGKPREKFTCRQDAIDQLR